jgi:hypothetical protein
MFNLYKGTSIGFPGIALPLLFSREILRVVKRVSHWIFLNLSVLKGNFEGGKKGDRAGSTSQMLWIFPYLSVLKGNLSRSLGAIAYTEWFPNKLPCIFSREILKVENRRSHGS